MGKLIPAMCSNLQNSPLPVLHPFKMKNYTAKCVDLCHFQSAARAHLNPFKNLVVSQIQLLGEKGGEPPVLF